MAAICSSAEMPQEVFEPLHRLRHLLWEEVVRSDQSRLLLDAVAPATDVRLGFSSSCVEKHISWHTMSCERASNHTRSVPA